MQRILSVSLIALLAAACGSNKNGSGDDGDGGNMPADACVGLECQVVNCGAMGQQPTTLTGTVFAPNGTLPLYGITVYVPLNDPGTPPDTLQCDRCSNDLPGGAVAQTTSKEDGTFRLENVPSGDNIPLVIKSGKWQRKVMLTKVDQCVDTPLAATETSLPKNKAEGNIPKIAITTGDADALECLVRKLGLEQEMSVGGGTGRVQLFAGDGANKVGATNMPSVQTLWDTADHLKGYDIVILSCEGGQVANATPKNQNNLDAMKAYADAGGRVFASHWHNIWIGGNFLDQNAPITLKPAGWASADSTMSGGITTWDRNDGNPGDPVLIDETSNPKGTSFANWMIAVGGSGPTTLPTATMRGQITTQSAGRRMTARTLDLTKAERWVYSQASGAPQNFQFTTPIEVTPDNRCGKVVFSDMHVSADSRSRPTVAFPMDCSNAGLTPQEKALAFMFFDIASCVGGIF
jgi:hypothetical protein